MQKRSLNNKTEKGTVNKMHEPFHNAVDIAREEKATTAAIGNKRTNKPNCSQMTVTMSPSVRQSQGVQVVTLNPMPIDAPDKLERVACTCTIIRTLLQTRTRQLGTP